jgi:hypothetical protein
MASVIIAAIALAISVFGGLYQLDQMIKGPHVKLYAPDQVLLSIYYPCENKDSKDCRPYLRIGADMNYTNTAAYGAIVVGECVSFRLDKEYVQTWEDFVRFEHPAIHRFDLKTTMLSQAHPIEVKPKNTLSHETYFDPKQRTCLHDGKSSSEAKNNQNYLSFQDFSKKLYPYSRKHKHIEFHFVAYIPQNKPKILEVKCRIKISDISKFVVKTLKNINNKNTQVPTGIAPECNEVTG